MADSACRRVKLKREKGERQPWVSAYDRGPERGRLAWPARPVRREPATLTPTSPVEATPRPRASSPPLRGEKPFCHAERPPPRRRFSRRALTTSQKYRLTTDAGHYGPARHMPGRLRRPPRVRHAICANQSGRKNGSPAALSVCGARLCSLRPCEAALQRAKSVCGYTPHHTAPGVC